MSNHVSTGMASGGIAGAIVVVIAWVLSLFHVTLPPEVASAFGIILTGAAVYLSSPRTAVEPPKPAANPAPVAPPA